MTDRARVWHAFVSGIITMMTLTEIFVIHSADWFTYLGIPIAIGMMLIALSED